MRDLYVSKLLSINSAGIAAGTYDINKDAKYENWRGIRKRKKQ